MYIEELKEGEVESGEEGLVADVPHSEIAVSEAKRALIGVGARFLFYPTLFYNVVRNKIQSEFRWWDGVDEFILLGAVPFPTDVPRLKQLGVCGVITLNEPYETLVPTSLYHAYGIEHLVIPTRDYLFAPSFGDICKAVDFIHKNASCGTTTYVHCKAGRGRSTTIVLCYLVQHKRMTPDAAYKYVRSIRPRVLLAPSQWQAVQEFYRLRVEKTFGGPLTLFNPMIKALASPALTKDLEAFDEGSVVVITEADLDGYDESRDSSIVGNEVWAELNLVYRVQFAGQAALARLSCLWLRCHARQKLAGEKLSRESSSCSMVADKLQGLGVDIRVY
ncbi:phosphatidylglycerophosphate phosphatase PTPMT2-like [Macadamia integrifolia]|uniref:phosphatidylglycerophosphate phosphatase PTPMT2-like n=1 Tax=Macadamia integrifolia TaxID=60698 RepID=UPI001C4EADED|nr:phosphatidylglycerophosphate phosphatase PTPMT2-like [Macadamia integrifolia]